MIEFLFCPIHGVLSYVIYGWVVLGPLRCWVTAWIGSWWRK